MFYFYIDELCVDQISSVTPVKTHLSNKIAQQFFQYLIDEDTGKDIWLKYPLLKRTSLKYNTPLTSSAPVERLFSFAGIINSPRRQSLSDYSFEKLVLLKANLKIFK